MLLLFKYKDGEADTINDNKNYNICDMNFDTFIYSISPPATNIYFYRFLINKPLK